MKLYRKQVRKDTKDRVPIAMSEVWNKIYKSDNTFFGEQPSNFALLCFNNMKANNVTKVLELGAGHGRDTIFFASNGIEVVEALDYSVGAVEIVDKVAKEKRLPIKPRIFDVRSSLPFIDGNFNAVYSHMLLNMKFSPDELHFIFSEIRRVLKPKGLNFFVTTWLMEQILLVKGTCFAMSRWKSLSASLIDPFTFAEAQRAAPAAGFCK